MGRRVVEVDALKVGGFEKFGLVPLDDWLIGYAENRGLSGDQLDELPVAVPAIRDLLKIPIFGAAALELVVGGQTLPETLSSLSRCSPTEAWRWTNHVFGLMCRR